MPTWYLSDDAFNQVGIEVRVGQIGLAGSTRGMDSIQEAYGKLRDVG